MIAHSLPDAFLENMRRLLGDEYPAFLHSQDESPALALRLNPKRQNAEAAALPFVDGVVPWAAHGRYLKPDMEFRPGSSIAHAAGAFYLQEASAMASAAVLDARPGERVLDLCAAPGGKSTQIAAQLSDRGLLVSNDPQFSRARILASNLERMGAANAIVTCAQPQQLAAQWEGLFDAVLVDAPCSGEGMFRRNPASRDEWSSSSPAGCAKRQAEILDQAARLVRPGGRLVYSTCTFNTEENEKNVLCLLDRHRDFSAEDFFLPRAGASEGGMLRLFPHRVRGDGHFVAKLRRAGSNTAPARSAAKEIPMDRVIHGYLNALSREISRLPEFVTGAELFLQGDRLYCRPWGCPRPDGICVLAPGLCLARLAKNRIEPEHALAMALPPEYALRRAELSETSARTWLRGESLPYAGERGWTLALFKGMPLGWGKASEGVLKNHLPKGLRIP